MPVLLKRDFEGTEAYAFWCPACKYGHVFTVKGTPPLWGFDGNLERPTFSPSLRTIPDGCHLFVSEGTLQFCGDARHELAGKTVPMVDWDTLTGEKTVDNQGQAPAPKPPASTDPPPATAPPVKTVALPYDPPSPAVQRVMNEGHDRVTAEKILADKAAAESPAAVAPTTPEKPSFVERFKQRVSPKAPAEAEQSPATKLILAQGYSADEAEAILDADIEGVLVNCDPQTRLVIVRTIASVLHKI